LRKATANVGLDERKMQGYIALTVRFSCSFRLNATRQHSCCWSTGVSTNMCNQSSELEWSPNNCTTQ